MRVHFIAIGGAIMHNLALALQRKGYVVTGSDDEIYEPSRSRLEQSGLLPAKMGWDTSRITPDIDAVILGMHARAGNPELVAATDLGLKIYSFPEFVAAQSKDKTRIVVAGSHGKTSTTSMIMHAMHGFSEVDYLVGAQLDGFDLMVQLTDAENEIIIEGDEYLSSPLDRRPKFLHYDPDYLVITGIAWDHMNVFPTWENYVDQFRQLLQSLRPSCKVYAFEGDDTLRSLCAGCEADVTFYQEFPHEHLENGAVAIYEGQRYPVPFFGQHNFQNMQAAWLVCHDRLMDPGTFLQRMESFRGAAMRLDQLFERDDLLVFRDFAHAPSKAKATVDAVRIMYPDERIVACLELHTFSSLNKDFLPEYLGAMQGADEAHVYYSPHTLEMKKLPPIGPEYVMECFGGNVHVHTDIDNLINNLSLPFVGVHLWMSSGRFGGLDLHSLYKDV